MPLALQTNIVAIADGRVLQRIHNVITTDGIALTLNTLSAGDSALVKYCALGTGATPHAASDTKLEAEQIRVPLNADMFYTPQPGQRLVRAFYAVPNFVIAEVGLFAGDDATPAPDSGVMLNRGNLNIDNTGSPKDITIEITLQLVGG